MKGGFPVLLFCKNLNTVKPYVLVPPATVFNISPRGFDNSALLVRGDRAYGTGLPFLEPAYISSFNLHENKALLVFCHNVDLVSLGNIVPLENFVAFFSKKSCGFLFTEIAKPPF